MALLKILQVTKRFGGIIALKNISFDIHDGEIVGIIGPNGAGKTTLFNIITGFLRPDEGKVIFKGEDITKLRPHEICKRGIARTFQLTQPFPNLSVLDNVKIGAYNRMDSESEVAAEAERVLQMLGLWHKRNELASSLSVGHRKSLELARALATRPQVLLLDETVSGLNPRETDEMISNIKKIHEAGVTILLVEHVMKVVMTLAERIVVISFGEKIAEGVPMEICRNPKVVEAYLGESDGFGSR
ncbi:MAG: ABC transporter ATP-binding protein [Candidatus Bathyarchaeia archaeon]